MTQDIYSVETDDSEMEPEIVEGSYSITPAEQRGSDSITPAEQRQNSGAMDAAVENLTDAGILARRRPDVEKLTSYDDVARALFDANAHVINTEDLDGGYTLLRDKDQLVGSEFIITSHTERISEQFGSTYSVIRLITKATNSRVVITDGSTGIHFQLSDLPDDAFVYCKNGLVRSDYPASEDYDPEARTGRPAGTTYYLDTSGGRLPAGTL